MHNRLHLAERGPGSLRTQLAPLAHTAPATLPLAGAVVGVVVAGVASAVGVEVFGLYAGSALAFAAVGALARSWASGDLYVGFTHDLELPGIGRVPIRVDRRHQEVAWKVLVELSTRIVSQPMDDDDGDDGVALRSLYATFTSIRSLLLELPPGRRVRGHTVETLALRLLNRELRPFLSRWHPRYDAWKKEEGEGAWPEHGPFREDLRSLQARVRPYIRSLAHVLELEADELLPS